MVEIQTGKYLGEDDIIRIEDKYGRKRINYSLKNKRIWIVGHNGMVEVQF